MKIQLYHKIIRELGCCISGSPDPTLHHCHGGSMRQFGQLRGIGQKVSDWLVIPLHSVYHSMGQFAIDGSYGVRRWESTFGTQVYWLDWCREHTGIDPFTMAGLRQPETVAKFP